MYKNDKFRIRKEIDGFISKGVIIPNSEVIVFGAGDYSREIISYLNSYGINISFIIDNDGKKNGSYSCGIKICKPEDISKELIEKAVFIICSLYWREMQSQLLKMKVNPCRIHIIILGLFGESEKEDFLNLLNGRRIYHRIKSLYPQKEIYLCPYTGTGDIYIIGSLFFQYLKKRKISNYVFVVVSKPCAMVAEIFSLENVFQIDGPEACRCLIKYYMVCPDECRLKILNDSWGDVYTNPTQWIRGLHGLNFTEMFRRFVFDLDKDCKPLHPIFKDVHEQTGKLFEELDLVTGKTVILAPYATTLADMPKTFWMDVAMWLSKQGYEVCTNCAGPDEKEIPGTKRISFPLNIAPQLVEKAGYFIGIRSGLCDVISGANAKKIILYDKANYFFNCTAFDYFSLKKMELCDDVIEIEYDNTKVDALRDMVCSYF